MNRLVLFWICFGAGVLCGAGAVWFFVVPEAPMVAAAKPEPVVNGETRAEVERLRTLFNEQRVEILRLRGDLEAERARAVVAVAPSADETAGGSADAVETEERPGRRMEERWNARMDRRADELAGQLGLTPAQRDAVAEVYREQMAHGRAQWRGETNAPFDLDGALERVLAPEQFSAYLEQSQQEIFNRAEVVAAAQLVRVSQAVPLSPDQESRLYDVIHYTAQEAMIARQTGAAFEMRSVLEERAGSILSPEQMEAFREVSRRGGPGGGFFGGP